MSILDESGPAFPQVDTRLRDEHGNAFTHVYSYGGMSLRDFFAAQAMQGPMVNADCSHPGGGLPYEIALWAYEQADAMLRAREAKW